MNLVNKGAQVLDVREPADFAGGHLVNSINIGLSGKFATWAGIVLNPNTPLVIIAEPGREQEAMIRLGRIGFDHVAGFLRDGMMALNSRPDLIIQTIRITAAALAETLTTSEHPIVIDVRTEREWQGGSIEHSLNIPLPHLTERLEEIPKDYPVVVQCASGYRSSIAASVLKSEGFTQVMDLVGGYDAWVKTWGRQDSTTKVQCVAS